VKIAITAITASIALAAPAAVQRTPVAAAAVRSTETAPRLLVAIPIDQFPADLFAEYRNRFTGGFARLLDGAVFPSGYQGERLYPLSYTVMFC
jgi:hypothetical protein